MSIFIRKNFSYPPKVFLSETLYFQLPKNLVICFKGTLASLLLDRTRSSHSCLLLLYLKQEISPQLLKLQISENHLNPPKTICKRPKPSAAIQNHAPKRIYNHPKRAITTQGHPQWAGIYLSCNWSGGIHIHVGAPTIIHGAFEANSSFHVKQSTATKVQFLCLRRFLLVLTKFSFQGGD